MISPATQKNKTEYPKYKRFFSLFILGFLLLGAQVQAQTLVTKYVDKDCTFNGTGDSSTCAASNGAAGAYNSFCNAEADITTDYPNLVTSDVYIDTLMAGTAADTCGPDINGQTTDATRYMRFRCDPGKGDGCNTTGVWSNSHYRLSTANSSETLVIQDDYVRIEGLQIENTGLADVSNRRGGVTISNTGSTTDIRILGNIIRFAGTGSKSDNDGLRNGGSFSGTVANNIVYGFTGRGISVTPKDNGTTAIYNNTTYNNGTNIRVDGGVNSNDTVRMFNNVMNGATTADYTLSGVLTSFTSGNNISEDTTSPDVAFRSKAVTFQDEVGRNLLLSSSDTQAKDAGSDRSVDSFYPFSTDILGATRPIGSAWDIGAHEETTVGPTPTPSPTPSPTPTPTPTPDFGCGRDTSRNGTVDNLCPGDDQDADGSTIAQGDCDDTDWQIFPGTPTGKGCSAGQWRQCKADGSGWTACSSATYCPSTAELSLNGNTWSEAALGEAISPVSSCKYFDASTGDNSTGDGSVGTPWRDLRKISYNFAGRATPVAGTAYILRGGTYDGTYVSTFDRHFLARNDDCTASSPCVIMCYPGEVCSFDFTAHAEVNVLYFLGSQYWFIDGLNATKDTGPVVNSEASVSIPRLFARRISAVGVRGAAGNNVAALKCDQGATCQLSHNYIYDVCDTVAGCGNENVCGIVQFRGEHTRVSYNVIDAPATMGCGVKIAKHADHSSVYTTSGNYIRNTTIGIAGQGRNSIYRNNLVITGAGTGCNSYANQGGTGYIGGMQFLNNTCAGGQLWPEPIRNYNISGSLAADICSGDYVPEEILYKDNIVSTGTDGIFSVAQYKPDSLRTDYITNGKLKSQDNCFNTSNATPFSEFSFNNGDTSCSGTARGDLGGSYNLAGWQSLGVDTGSQVINPNLAANTYLPVTNCTDKGYRSSWPTIGSSSGGGGGGNVGQGIISVLHAQGLL